MICNKILGSTKEYKEHMENTHKAKTTKKEYSKHMALIE